MRSLPALSILVAAIAAIPAPSAAAQEVSAVERITACYVPGPGLLYRTGVDGAGPECRSSSDIPLAWNGPVDLATLQVRVEAGCPAGSALSAIAADGTVTCDPDDDSAAGVDFATFQRRVAGECPEGQAIRAVGAGGSVDCHADGTANLAGLQLRVAEACPEGSIIRAIDAAGNVQCQLDGISAFQVTGEFAVARGDDGGTSTVSMGSGSRRACFLVQVEMEDLDAFVESGTCRVTLSGSTWALHATLFATDDANVWCRARCVTW